MSAAEEHVGAELPGASEDPQEDAPARHGLPTEGRRALIATALGAAVGLLAALFSRRDPGDEG